MTTYGKVTQINNDNTAIVEVVKLSACTGKCTDCKGCQLANAKDRVKNDIGAKKGDIVEIYAPTRNINKLAFIMYMLPVFIILISAVLFTKLNYLLSGVIILLLISLYICFIIYENRKYKNNTINSITKIMKHFEKENIND